VERSFQVPPLYPLPTRNGRGGGRRLYLATGYKAKKFISLFRLLRYESTFFNVQINVFKTMLMR
jgi:hypothetical protein